MALFIAHTLLLLAASHGSVRRLIASGLDRILATFLLAWGNLILTSLLLSGVNHLGNPAWFFRASLGLALATWLLLRRVTPAPAAAVPESKLSRGLVAGFLLTLVPIAWASVRIAATYVPNNFDSMAYHLPRALFYLGQNNLAHFDTGNPRQIFFPFNYNLLQAYTFLYAPPLPCLNFINLAAWVLSGLAVYRLCRLGAVSANASLIAAWMVLTSTQILAQATATTNDLPTGAGLLVTLVFLLRWRESRLARDALLAGLGAGLTIGAKLTVIFFAPAAGLLVLFVAWSHWRHGETRLFLTGARAWILPALVAFVFAAPFALINIAETGHWINNTYDFTLNRPFSLACVAQTSAAYLVQLFLEPLHRFTYDMKFTALLNTWGQHALFPHWNPAYAFSDFMLFPPDLNEDHVWFGFAGPVILLCGVFCVARPRQFSRPMVWLAWLGLGWFATYFTLNKWSLYNHRYFVPAILVLAPSLGAVVAVAWADARFQRTKRLALLALAFSAVWLAGVYLFQNTSRPYGPLWAGRPAPPALPPLPPVMAARLPSPEWINIISAAGNERTFLLMAQGSHQRFTAHDRVQPGAYNVFSEWGFPRKIAYTNIEQLSSYTIVPIPFKHTAGVENLGTIGTGVDAWDYYGLSPHSDQLPADPSNRNVLVVMTYGPREPDRYKFMRTRIVGLHPADQARVSLGVEYEDGTTANLADFTESSEAATPVTRPFRRFTFTVTDQPSGREIAAVTMPHVSRDEPPDVETPNNPELIFSEDLITTNPGPRIAVTGLGAAEGPYPQWDLPLIRWAKLPVVRLEIPATKDLARIDLAFSFRLHVRETATVDVVFNGVVVKSYHPANRLAWVDETVSLVPVAGKNVLEFRNVAVSDEPDWLDYLARYPDVKAYLDSQHYPYEKGASEHYAMFGPKEHRLLFNKRQTESLPESKPFYFMLRTLRLDGFRKP